MRRLIVEIEKLPMIVEFHPSLRLCTVRYLDAIFEDLEVKRRWMGYEREYLYEIIVPTIPKPYMLAIGKDALYGYEHPERQELTIKEPAEKKKRKKDSGQRGLWD